MSYVQVQSTSILVHYWLQKAFKMSFEHSVYLTNGLFMSAKSPSQKEPFEFWIQIKQLQKLYLGLLTQHK